MRLHTGTGTGFRPLKWRRAAHSDRFGARCTLPTAQSTRSIEQDDLLNGLPGRTRENIRAYLLSELYCIPARCLVAPGGGGGPRRQSRPAKVWTGITTAALVGSIMVRSHERTIRRRGTSELRWPGPGRAGTACSRAPGEAADRAEGTACHRSLRSGAQHESRLAQRGGSACRSCYPPAGSCPARPRGPCRPSLKRSECSRGCSTGSGCPGSSSERRPYWHQHLPPGALYVGIVTVSRDLPMGRSGRFLQSNESRRYFGSPMCARGSLPCRQ